MAKRPDTSIPGLVIVDKPAGLTSHDVVSRMRRLARTRKVGHAGTLDPMATGVLVIGVGTATRLLTWVSGHSKSYDATIRFGIATSTDDAEGEPIAANGGTGFDEARLAVAMRELTGDIMQVPSKVSAIKVDGKRAYALVREGVEVDLKARPVTVSRFDLVSVPRIASTVGPNGEEAEVVDVDVSVDCSSGTYIRALARDLGSILGTGAHLTALRRTRVGAFTLDDSHALGDLEAEAVKRAADGGEARLPAPGLIGLDDAAIRLFPVIELDAKEEGLFAHGQAPIRVFADIEGAAMGEAIAVKNRAGRVLGLVAFQGEKLRTQCVFVGDDT